MTKNYLFLGIFSIAIFTSCKKDLNYNSDLQNQLAAGQGVNNGRPEIGEENHVPNELLVKFKKGVSENVKANVLAKIGGKVSEKVLTKAMQRVGDNEGFLVVGTSLNALEAISRAKGFGEVEFAEPNYIYTHDAATNDTYVANAALWGMDASNTYGSQASTAWAA